MNNQILSIGTANPGEAIPQMMISDFMKIAHGLEERDSRVLNFVYKQSGIKQRYSVLDDFRYDNPENFVFFPKNKMLNPFPGTKQRMQVFQFSALNLAKNAILECLKNGLVYPNEITHLILVSCTGMFAPGLELKIIHEMGFNANIERYSIHFMGCYAAFNGLKLADKICSSTPKAKVLVVSVELCTIHFQKEYTEDNLLANAIFGDGAAAALVTRESEGLQIKKYDSQLFKNGEEDMAWSIGDFGFEMRLSKYVPDLLFQGLHQIQNHLENVFQLSEIRNFAIHPGGKQILQKVEEAFGIHTENNRFSHDILENCGNMSSASILFVLKKWLEADERSGPLLAMGFGPGLTLETMLLEK
ncbi:type III polyketide synthase [Cecembia lonarensis]|uniref:Alpha-pyrone synthesis polyketide synthase-like Pks18 n=1 Tax=Cecembia lonarensis (strain CCUG 58316 / KCTC 22772 / LW9) TaxID=1225176 RepID=K1L7Z6_CECL9|nr:type III polyketide synthase [Cecembia lonarensis]EKB50776.1 Alpha-pyrone synthesis polyketide synthase-like Pks18 [Cecembia lonarensis LW9]